MNALLKMRSSNLVLLIVLPIFAYLTLTSSDYSRSFIAIIGAEPKAASMFLAFLTVVVPLFIGISEALVPRLMPNLAKKLGNNLQHVVLLEAILLIAVTPFIDFGPLVNAIIVNAIDPLTSPDVIPNQVPYQLNPTALQKYLNITHGLIFTAAATLALCWALRLKGPMANERIAIFAKRIIYVINLSALGYFLFVAHLGFASGLFLSIRAVIFAYIAASIMGLILAAALGLKPKNKTYVLAIGFCILCAAGALFSFLQPKTTYVLVGDASQRVVLIKGTPTRMIDGLRESEPVIQAQSALSILSTTSIERATKLFRERDNVSGMLIEQTQVPIGEQYSWQAEILPDFYNNLGFALVVFMGIGIVLTFSSFQHGKHPAAIGAELFIDTIRGIPMLVIILYVGLPLAGNIRDISNGYIDLAGFWRGVIAISIGYSAYMAEIFRAGIQSVPKGQLEAAQSLGLSRWHTARFIILPQALKVITPALGNEFIAMLKDTSLLSVLSVRDITQRMREFQASSFLPFAPFNTAAILYVVLTLAIASALSSLERRQNRSNVR
jgi:polar amino acid transport system permease protein